MGTKLSFVQVGDIFKTLPTGYYLGRKIKADLSEDIPGSFYDPESDRIIVSFPCIQEAFEHAALLPTDTLEQVIRGLLYHEISHVILTPRKLMARAKNSHEKKVFNILEDERIETICRNYYLNVNFRRLVVILNNYKGEPAMDKDGAFYHLVRYHEGKPEWLNKLKEVLKCTMRENAYSDSEGWDLASEYRKFWDWFSRMYDEEEARRGAAPDETYEKSEESTGEMTEGMSGGSGETSDKDKSEGESKKSEGDSKSDTKDGEDSKEDSDKSKSKGDPDQGGGADGEGEVDGPEKDYEKVIPEIFDDKDPSFDEAAKKVMGEGIKKVVNRYFDNSLSARLNTIICQQMKKKSKNGSAIPAYAGRMDPMQIALRDDYRWWLAQNRDGHVKAYDKIHFNLFIDNSGSCSSNDDRMNTFIKSLDRIKDPNFSFDIITINTEIKEWKTHDQLFDSWGGNRIPDRLQEVFKRHQQPRSTNCNIVLFDGDCHSDDRFYGKKDNLRFFDTENTIIISDTSNEDYFEEVIHKARVELIDGNYCSRFIETVCAQLERML